jgi:hypothetical protein
MIKIVNILLLAMLMIILFKGASLGSDLPECLSSMAPMVSTQVVGNKIIVTLSKDVPRTEYEAYYHNVVGLFCACERVFKPGSLKGFKKIIVQNAYGKAGMVFEVGDGGLEVCHDISYPVTKQDKLKVLGKTHYK